MGNRLHFLGSLEQELSADLDCIRGFLKDYATAETYRSTFDQRVKNLSSVGAGLGYPGHSLQTNSQFGHRMPDSQIRCEGSSLSKSK